MVWQMKNYCPELYVNSLGCKLRLTPFFEPIWNSKGKLISLEMLTRLHDIEKNVEFSPVIYFQNESKAGQFKVFQWQLEILADILHLCQEKNFTVSINISRVVAEQVVKTGIVQEIENLAPWICLEINESAIPPGIALHDDPIFSELKNKAPLWLDDFGCGTTSIPLLINGGFEVIKIGHNLISQLSNKFNGLRYLSGLNALSADNNTPLIAEGVSSTELWLFCQRAGVFACQGWLWKGIPYLELPFLSSCIPLQLHINQYT